MALNALECNRLASLGLKGCSKQKTGCEWLELTSSAGLFQTRIAGVVGALLSKTERLIDGATKWSVPSMCDVVIGQPR